MKAEDVRKAINVVAGLEKSANVCDLMTLFKG
jgi:hypothetical protein